VNAVFANFDERLIPQIRGALDRHALRITAAQRNSESQQHRIFGV